MTQRSRFFDSVAGDRVYTSDAWAQVVAALMGTGVVKGFGNALNVHESSPAAMSVRVNTGVAFLLGYFFETYTSQETLTIAAADPTNPRIDRVIIRRSLANREATLVVLTGTPGAVPVAPALTTNTSGTYEVTLARVAVAAGATSIVDANITDERTYCQAYDVIAALSTTTGHAHDGADSKTIAYSALTSVPTSFAPATHTHASAAAGVGGQIAYSALTGVPSSFAPSTHTHADGSTGGTVAYSVITGKPSTFAPSAHASSHTNGGSDEVSIDWTQITSGKPTTFAPVDHTHASAGAQAGTIAYSVLTGKPSTFAPSAHAADHTDGGADEIAISWAQITSGKPNLGIISDNVAGDTGVTIYVQTTTPTGVDGDVWIKG